jgi:hypothetical protein
MKMAYSLYEFSLTLQNCLIKLFIQTNLTTTTPNYVMFFLDSGMLYFIPSFYLL